MAHVPFSSEYPTYSGGPGSEILTVSLFVPHSKAPVSTEFSGWGSVNSVIDNYVDSGF